MNARARQCLGFLIRFGVGASENAVIGNQVECVQGWVMDGEEKWRRTLRGGGAVAEG